MGKVNEQRVERRLRYRWPVRFAKNANEKALSGQMFDLSSKGLAFLFYADRSCPCPGQSIAIEFRVPYFNTRDSFDMVFFKRISRICRIDNLSSQVNRVAVQFAEPLFFKPGEQSISDSKAEQLLEAKTQMIVKARK